MVVFLLQHFGVCEFVSKIDAVCHKGIAYWWLSRFIERGMDWLNGTRRTILFLWFFNHLSLLYSLWFHYIWCLIASRDITSLNDAIDSLSTGLSRDILRYLRIIIGNFSHIFDVFVDVFVCSKLIGGYFLSVASNMVGNEDKYSPFWDGDVLWLRLGCNSFGILWIILFLA